MQLTRFMNDIVNIPYNKATLNGILKRFSLTSGHERTVRAKKNILASFIIKGLNIAIGLILVPLTINYLNPIKYGIWITLSSIIAWFGFFDIGLGHGLRNRFAEALAIGNHKLAKTYVSTTYAILSIIIILVLILFYLVNPFLNWAAILNTGSDPTLKSELSLLALIVFTFFCLQFISKIITTILLADQQPAKSSLFDFCANALSLLFIIILTKVTSGSLIYIGAVFSIIPVLVLMLASFLLFNGRYKCYKPSIKSVDFSKAKDLFSLGIKFFIIQIAAVLLYQTNNIIITQLFGPAEVTPYNVAFKYFSIIMMVFSIILSPFWSAFTESWVRKEIDWIQRTMRKLFQIWSLILIAAIFMIIISPWVYKIWIGNNIIISSSLSILVGIWIIVNTWNGIFSYFLNGVGKIKIQLVIGISSALLNVPLAFLSGKVFGINGVIIINILLVLIGAFIYPIQYFRLINSSARGIWNE